MTKYQNIIAIDADVTKSGVEYLEDSTRKLELSSLTFPQLTDYLNYVKEQRDKLKQTVIVVVEASNLHF